MAGIDLRGTARPSDSLQHPISSSGSRDLTRVAPALWIRALLCMALLPALVSQALAGGSTTLWISNTSGSWFDDANWVGGDAPEPGVGVQFGNGGFEDPIDVVDLENGGNGVSQPADTLLINDKVRFIDSSAGGDAAFADDGMVFDTVRVDGAGGAAVIFDIPVSATTVLSQRHGAVFNREISVAEIRAVSGHQDRWQINGGVTGSIARVLLDENRGPDGDTIDGFMALNSTLAIELFDHVWGRLRVGSGAFAAVGTYIYSDYTGRDEFANINPIRIDGTLLANQFTVFSVASETASDLPEGSHGGIGHPTANFEQEFISGDGLLIVQPDGLFQNGFE